jgi:hypothetical protein
MAVYLNKYTTIKVGITHTAITVGITPTVFIDMDIGIIIDQLKLAGTLGNPKRSSAEGRPLTASSDGYSV